MRNVCRIKAAYSTPMDETFTVVQVEGDDRMWWARAPQSWPAEEIAFATLGNLEDCQHQHDAYYFGQSGPYVRLGRNPSE